MPPLPLPMRLILSSWEKFRGGEKQEEEVEEEDGAEVGGRGRGTANLGSRWGSGRVRSGRRRERLRFDAGEEEEEEEGGVAAEEAAGGDG